MNNNNNNNIYKLFSIKTIDICNNLSKLKKFSVEKGTLDTQRSGNVPFFTEKRYLKLDEIFQYKLKKFSVKKGTLDTQRSGNVPFFTENFFNLY